MDDMQGKVCMVTGATDGIGKVTARQLAALGATVIVVGRNPQKGEAVVADIQTQTGSKNVLWMGADLSSLAEIQHLADEFTSRYGHLHVLVNNAGAWMNVRQESADGIEMTWALNHLNYFLLTHLLLETIQASAPARIVNVSSDAHYRGHINFDNLESKQRYNGMTAYSNSKLANVLFTYELARRLEGTHVTANALHPGFVRTQFGHNNGRLMRMAMSIVHRVAAIDVETGAKTQIYLATSPEVEGISGQYFDKCQSIRSSIESYDEAIAKRLWEVSEQMTGIHAAV